MAAELQSVDQVKSRLGEVGYLADEPAALVSFLAAQLGKPVLVEGPAGVGKTELAKALARATERRLIRLQCYEGLDEAKALYEWNYRKQLLRIQTEAQDAGWETVKDDIFGEEFLLERPLLTAIAAKEPVVLLIDEIDKTDQEFEAMLLELLSDFQISIPELGTIEATSHPIVVLTSNNSRELTEALKRRCLYLWLDYPDAEREHEIVRLHAPDLPESVSRRLVEVVHMVRNLDLKKPPSIAESIDWARALLLLGATLAKSQEDRRVFDILFDRYFFRAVEREAVERGLTEQQRADDGGYQGDQNMIDLESLRNQILGAVREGSDGEMRDLARLAIAAFGREGTGSGVIGVDVQRIRRTLGLKGQSEQDMAARPDPDAVPRERLRQFERHLRRELERDMIERTEALPPARPLREFDRALPTNPLQDLAAVHRIVMQLKRRLATQGHEMRGRRRGRVVDVRRTMRSSLETGGVPLRLRYRPKRPRRPELFVLCDVSTSVTSASVFFLSVLHALHDSFRKLRSFVFVERISEVTEVFERERSFKAVSRAIATDSGVADVSGYTDYGRVWLEFYEQVIDDLDPRSTVIVLGDARTNGREPHAKAFGAIAARASRMFWMNPEPKLYGNYGVSVMAAYEPYCDGVFECWTTKQLEVFVNAIADLQVGA